MLSSIAEPPSSLQNPSLSGLLAPESSAPEASLLLRERETGVGFTFGLTWKSNESQEGHWARWGLQPSNNKNAVVSASQPGERETISAKGGNEETGNKKRAAGKCIPEQNEKPITALFLLSCQCQRGVRPGDRAPLSPFRNTRLRLPALTSPKSGRSVTLACELSVGFQQPELF